MIFRLQCTVDELARTRKDELEDVFSKLIDADRSGRHFFISPRELCDWIVENIDLSGRDCAHLVSIREQYAVRGGLVAVARPYVDVTIGDASVSFDGMNTFFVGHRSLIEGRYLSSSTGFIVEDIGADTKLYRHVLNETRKITKVPSFEFDPIHGGGSTTDRVFDHEIQRRRVVVCVVDHDKLAPGDARSSAANRVELNYVRRNCDETRGDQCFIGLGILTIGRELENYIPYHLFKEMENYRNYAHFNKLDEIVCQHGCISPDNCFWKYFDIKEGINGEGLKEKLNKGKISDEVFNWICGKIGCEPEEIERNSIDGFGNGVINAFFSSPQALCGFHKFVRSEFWRGAFGDYFEKLLWFFAAPKCVRT